jgi:hypothetical protein
VLAHITLESEYADRQLTTSHAQRDGAVREGPRR